MKVEKTTKNHRINLNDMYDYRPLQKPTDTQLKSRMHSKSVLAIMCARLCETKTKNLELPAKPIVDCIPRKTFADFYF